jgi:hypothetical protein
LRGGLRLLGDGRIDLRLAEGQRRDVERDVAAEAALAADGRNPLVRGV